MKPSLAIATIALVFSAIFSLAPTIATADYSDKAPGGCESSTAQTNRKCSGHFGQHHHIAAFGNSMDVNARLMKLHARLASPLGEARSPIVFGAHSPVFCFWGAWISAGAALTNMRRQVPPGRQQVVHGSFLESSRCTWSV